MQTNIKFCFRGTRRPQVFPIGEGGEGDTATQAETQGEGAGVRRNYPCLRVGGGNNKGLIANALQERDYKGGQLVAWSKSHRTGKTDADKRRKNYGQVEQRIKYGEANTINTGIGGGNQSTQNFVVGEQRIRRLTPTECERLQGFPDGWTEGVSDTQRYKCLGNAVTVNVVQAIMERLLNNTQEDCKG